VKKEFEHQHAIAREVALESADVVEAVLPDVLVDDLFRQLLGRQHLRVDARHQHVLVIGAVEQADVSAPGEVLGVTPEECVVELFRARLLEGMHLAAHGIDARHHMLDDAVLARRVRALQDHKHRPATLRVEPLLQIREAPGILGELCLGLVPVDVDAVGIGRIAIGKPEFLRPVDPHVLDDFFDLHRPSQSD